MYGLGGSSGTGYTFLPSLVSALSAFSSAVAQTDLSLFGAFTMAAAAVSGVPASAVSLASLPTISVADIPGVTAKTRSQSATPSVSPHPFFILLLPSPTPVPQPYALSDSQPPLSLTMQLNRCPPGGASLVTSCSTTSDLGVAVYATVSAPAFSLTCSATNVTLPSTASVGAVFGTGGGGASVACQIVDAVSGQSYAYASARLAVTASLWPTWSDAIVVGPTGVMHSWLFNDIVDGKPWLAARLAASPLCNASAAPVAAGSLNCSTPLTGLGLPRIVLGAVQDAYGGRAGESLNASLRATTEQQADQFKLTLTGASLLAVRAIRSVFSGGTSAVAASAMVAGVACNVTAVSEDGRWALISTPSTRAICPGGPSTSDCGYVAVTLTNLAIVPALLGASLTCPPFCALESLGASKFGVPFPVFLGVSAGQTNSSAAVSYAVAAPGYGGSQGPVILAPPSSTVDQSGASGGLYYAAPCSASLLYTDPTTGRCLNASDPASRLCAYGAGDACSLCPNNALCPGGFRMWPLPGYWAAAECDGVVYPCPPPAERCLGWSAASGASLCGRGRTVWGVLGAAPGQ